MQGTPREIFSQVERMQELQLDVPQVTLLGHELRKAGLNIPVCILTKEELADALLGAADTQSDGSGVQSGGRDEKTGTSDADPENRGEEETADGNQG